MCACVRVCSAGVCMHAYMHVYVCTFFLCVCFGLGSVPVFPENLLETNLLLSEIQYDLMSYSELKIYP